MPVNAHRPDRWKADIAHSVDFYNNWFLQFGSVDVESLRLELQGQLDATRTQHERNRLGQFATPTALATDIMTCASSMLPDDAKIRFLDPAFGTGAFYSALSRVFSSDRITRAAGFEIDPHYGVQAQQLWQATPLGLRLTDFTRAAPPAIDDERYNLLICSP